MNVSKLADAAVTGFFFSFLAGFVVPVLLGAAGVLFVFALVLSAIDLMLPEQPPLPPPVEPSPKLPPDGPLNPRMYYSNRR
jgi:hypothetical protein